MNVALQLYAAKRIFKSNTYFDVIIEIVYLFFFSVEIRMKPITRMKKPEMRIRTCVGNNMSDCKGVFAYFRFDEWEKMKHAKKTRFDDVESAIFKFNKLTLIRMYFGMDGYSAYHTTSRGSHIYTSIEIQAT